MLATLTLLTIQLGTALYMEWLLTNYAFFELFVLFIALLAGVCIFYGTHLREQWSGTALASFHFLNGINLTWLVVLTGSYWAYLFGMLFVVVGFLRGIAQTEEEDWLQEYLYDEPLQTYNTTEQEQVVDPDPIYVNFAREEPVKRKTRKTRKKSKTKRKKS